MEAAAVPPNLVWSTTVKHVLEALPDDVRSSYSYIGPANSVGSRAGGPAPVSAR